MKNSTENINSHLNLNLTGVHEDPVPEGSRCTARGVPESKHKKIKPASEEKAKGNTTEFGDKFNFSHIFFSPSIWIKIER